MTAIDGVQLALRALYYLSPILIIAYYILAVAVRICTLQDQKSLRSSPRKTLIGLSCLVSLSYGVEACMLIVDTFANNSRCSTTASNVSKDPVHVSYSLPLHLTGP